MSYPQLGEASRYLHKSQGMGNDIPVAPRKSHQKLIKSAVKTESTDLFAGIPYDFHAWADLIPAKNVSSQLDKLQNDLEGIIKLYPDREAILPESQKALGAVQKLIASTNSAKLDASVKNDLLHKLELKAEQLQQVSFVSSSLAVDMEIGSYVLTQGEKTQVAVKVTNEGKEKIQHIEAALLTPDNWKHEGVNQVKHLKPGESKTVTFNVTVPADAEYYQPYGDAVIKAQLTFKENGVKTTSVIDLDNTVSVLPELGVTPDPVNITVNTANVQEEIPVTVKVKNYANGAKNAAVSLNLPEGWTSEPAAADISFTERYEEKEVSFTLVPPKDIDQGNFTIAAIAAADGKSFDTTVQEIKYDHINDSYFMYPSNINGVAFELLKPDNLKVGYIDSGFDTIADSLLNAGFDITKITPENLANNSMISHNLIQSSLESDRHLEDQTYCKIIQDCLNM